MMIFHTGQPSRDDMMLAANISANRLCPRLTLVPNVAFYACWPPVAAGDGGEDGGVITIQQSHQKGDQRSNYQWIFLRTPEDISILFHCINQSVFFFVCFLFCFYWGFFCSY